MTPPSDTTSDSPPREAGATGDKGRVTRLLTSCSAGDDEAFDRLIPLVYTDLRSIAHRRLRSERDGHTLDTTDVVHEAYLRLANEATATWRDRAHFFAVASRVIRHVLVDYARRRDAKKRGGEQIRVPLDDNLAGDEPRFVDLITLDKALTELARRDERMAKIVECRFFGGMTMEETGEAVGVPLRTAERSWSRARAHLYAMLSPEETGAGPSETNAG